MRLPSSSSGGPAVSSSNESATQIPTDYHSLRPWTRLQSGIIKPFKRTDGTIPYGNFCSTGEPKDLHEALGDARWTNAMREELGSLQEQDMAAGSSGS